MIGSLGLWAVVWLYTGQAAAQVSFPPPIHYVADYADVIDTSHENELNGLLQRLEMNTGVPYIILTVQTLKGDSLSRFTKKTAVSWKLRQEGKDKGVLFVLVKQDKTYCYEVGREMRALLTEEVLRQVGEDVLKPCLRAEKTSEGIYQGNVRIIQKIAGEYGAILHDSLQSSSQQSGTPKPWQEYRSRSGWHVWMVAIGIIVAAGLGLGRIIKRSRSMRSSIPLYGFGTGGFGLKGVWGGGCFGGGFGAFGAGPGELSQMQKNNIQPQDRLGKTRVVDKNNKSLV